ncbi:hypothetical protein MFRU_012g00620 [Monilinia fructicola]|nr:hypothetical protein MFRU_012g00620 [Monilinia fructicola]
MHNPHSNHPPTRPIARSPSTHPPNPNLYPVLPNLKIHNAQPMPFLEIPANPSSKIIHHAPSTLQGNCTVPSLAWRTLVE